MNSQLQLSWSLSDEVAPHFKQTYIKNICTLIDEKLAKGLKYNDLKRILLAQIANAVDLDNDSDSFDIYRRAYEFAKYY